MTLRLVEGAPREAQLFLLEGIPGVRGPERPSEVLLAAEFFPVMCDEKIRIIPRESVVALTVSMEFELAAGPVREVCLGGGNQDKENCTCVAEEDDQEVITTR